jgi:hypothetical protein
MQFVDLGAEDMPLARAVARIFGVSWWANRAITGCSPPRASGLLTIKRNTSNTKSAMCWTGTPPGTCRFEVRLGPSRLAARHGPGASDAAPAAEASSEVWARPWPCGHSDRPTTHPTASCLIVLNSRPAGRRYCSSPRGSIRVRTRAAELGAGSAATFEPGPGDHVYRRLARRPALTRRGPIGQRMQFCSLA